jgi:hypothetical protein
MTTKELSAIAVLKTRGRYKGKGPVRALVQLLWHDGKTSFDMTPDMARNLATVLTIRANEADKEDGEAGDEG